MLLIGGAKLSYVIIEAAGAGAQPCTKSRRLGNHALVLLKKKKLPCFGSRMLLVDVASSHTLEERK